MGSSNLNINSKITDIFAYQVFDSRGVPTVACVVKLASGHVGEAMVPSGASTGEKEAIELRDNDPKNYFGKGVNKAVDNVNKVIAPKLIGLNAFDQLTVDQAMIKLDNTPNKAKLGANAILSVSLAVSKAAAKAQNSSLFQYISNKLIGLNTTNFVLPVPMLNVINGGAHADNYIDFQEFMIIPLGAKKMHEALKMASETFHALQNLLKKRGLNTNKGDEGGFAPNLKLAEDALDIMVEAIKLAGYKPWDDIAIAIDVAASEFYDEDKKLYVFKKGIKANILNAKDWSLTSKEMIAYLEKLTKKYPIISIEDGLSENDWEGMNQLTKTIGSHIQIVGDDTYCTNAELAKKGVAQNTTNSILIKLNQIGSISETIQTIEVAKKANWSQVISHRSGETEDTTIADLAVAAQTGQIKTGSMSRSERIAKYNRLLYIEIELGDKGKYLGWNTFTNIKPKNFNI
ncbi:phosphopyruvate hydratase [Mycoplasmoides genitalium]